MKGNWKYSEKMGFRTPKYKKATCSEDLSLKTDSSQKQSKGRPKKKVKVSIPVFGIEKYYENVNEVAAAFNVDVTRIYAYIRNNGASTPFCRFEWDSVE